jgi:hypothetical protein
MYQTQAKKARKESMMNERSKIDKGDSWSKFKTK